MANSLGGVCANMTLEDLPLPSEGQIKGLTLEVYIVIMIYVFTITFTVYNIVEYLWKQQRYRTWLVTIFYILAIIVLTTRLAQYVFTLFLNHAIVGKIELYNTNATAAMDANYTNIVHTYRKIGQCLTYSDFSKIALGFVQLASMCRLAIEIRYSVYHLIRNQDKEEDGDSALERLRS